MTPADKLIAFITQSLPGVETQEQYGYTFFFYGPDRKLPFATLATTDQEFDQFSNLNRPGVYRFNLGISKPTFQALFGDQKLDLAAYDFTALDTILPHPEYAAQSFVCVLSPENTMPVVERLLAEAHELAVQRHAKREKSE